MVPQCVCIYATLPATTSSPPPTTRCCQPSTLGVSIRFKRRFWLFLGCSRPAARPHKFTAGWSRKHRSAAGDDRRTNWLKITLYLLPARAIIRRPTRGNVTWRSGIVTHQGRVFKGHRRIDRDTFLRDPRVWRFVQAFCWKKNNVFIWFYYATEIT